MGKIIDINETLDDRKYVSIDYLLNATEEELRKMLREGQLERLQKERHFSVKEIVIELLCKKVFATDIL